VVHAAAYVLARLLAVEAVQTSVSGLIAKGINAFLRQPNLEQMSSSRDSRDATFPSLLWETFCQAC